MSEQKIKDLQLTQITICNGEAVEDVIYDILTLD